jgi:hypothetical protein
VVDVTTGSGETFSPAGGGQSSNNFSTVFIRLPDAATSVALRVWALNNSVDEIWNLDNIEVVGEAGTPPVGVPPVLALIGNRSTLTNLPLVIAVSATATDGDPVTLTVSNAPGGATFGTTNTAGTFTWPAPGPAGDYTVSFYAEDKDGIVSETITITVTNTPVPPSGGMETNLWINEVHYDNGGIAGDTNEGFEVAGPAGTDLSQYNLYLYDGTTSGVYSNIPLSGTIPDEQNGFGAVWVQTGYSFSGQVQNGPNDGVALVFNTTGVIQFVSYEGVINAASGPAAGLTSVDIGAQESNTTPEGQALQLCGTGTTYAAFVATGGWTTNTATRGLLNACQVIPAAGGNDDDGDGIPNDWEVFYFGTTTGAVALVDFDIDGVITLDEYIAGTDPTDSNDFFAAEAIMTVGANREIRFPTRSGREYQVVWSTNLVGVQQWFNITNGVPGTGAPVTVVDTSTAARAYQIRTKIPTP